MKTVLKYLKPFAGRMSVGLSIKIFGTVIELVLPYILSHILKNVVQRESIAQIVYWGILMVVCSLVACICHIVANRMAARVSRNFSENVRRDLFAKTMRLSAKQTDNFTIPSLESRITTDTYNVHNFVGMMQRMGVRARAYFTYRRNTNNAAYGQLSLACNGRCTADNLPCCIFDFSKRSSALH